MTTPSEHAAPPPGAGASRWTVAIFALIGLGIGLVAFAFRTPTYQAEALIAVSNPVGSLEDEIAIVTGDTVTGAAEAVLGFAPDITVTAAEVAGLLTIVATDDDPEQAADAANTIANTYVQAQSGAAANVAQAATTPDSPSGLGPLVYALLGTLVGASIGAVVSYLQSTAGARRPTLDLDLRTPSEPMPAQVSPPVEVLPAMAAATIFDHESSHRSLPSTPTATPMDKTTPPAPVSPSSFSIAASSDDAIAPAHAQPTWLEPEPAATELSELERRSLQSQFESARYELILRHDEDVAKIRADHERHNGGLRNEIARLNKQVRMQAARLKNQSGTGQNRVGDLEAQVDALEVELAALRQQVETERIAHTKKLTEERGAADRALDNARRQYREELAKHVHTHRATMAEHREDLDRELAEARGKHAASLEAQHIDYEVQLEAERIRAEAKHDAAAERHQREMTDLQEATKQELDRQAAHHKDTISSLRGAGESSESHLRDLEKENRMLRVEIGSLQKQTRHNENEHSVATQRITDELAIMRSELEGERERNAALRADVLRRSAEAHQVIDRAVEERTAQLTELEASVSRQREYADARVREVSASAEEQARQAATREASMTATISRLKRELEDATKGDESVS